MPLRLFKEEKYVFGGMEKIDKKVEKTRTEVRENEEMQLKMCYRSFKKN